MSGNWITLERRIYKEALALSKEYEQQELYPYDECFKKAYEEKTKFLEAQWTRAIELEIRFEKLRKKMREEAGLENSTNPENLPKLKYMVDITFPDETPLDTRLEFTKEFYTALDAPLELAIEQRGHTEETYGKGVHVHANITNKQLTLQSVKKTASPFLKKHKLKDNIIEFNVLTKDHYKNRIDYIRGLKVDKPDKDGIAKSLKLPYDKRFREEHGLLDLYTCYKARKEWDDRSGNWDIINPDTLHLIPTVSRSKPNERLCKNDITIRHNVPNSLTPFGLST